MVNYNSLKKFALKMDPEKAHHLFLTLFQKTPYLIKPFYKPIQSHDKYRVKSKNLNWDFPIGLAAGFDKDALVTKELANMGFGSIEIGTITPKPQVGNPRPRIFRYPKQLSLRNSMGFPGDGMKIISKRIDSLKNRNFSLGVNLGKNKTTSEKEACLDYQVLYEEFAPKCDYLVINLSSPNTPGLRELQKADSLEIILKAVDEKRKIAPRALFLKISPDLNLDDLDDIITVADKYNLSGIVATNTTIREDLGPGGVSGELLKDKARIMRLEVLKRLKAYPNMDLIGVGGINSFAEVKEFFENGGKFLQIYTSFIYSGADILHEIQEGIDDFLKEHKCLCLEDYFTKA
jgi:dihydroorotate dehydrogenase